MSLSDLILGIVGLALTLMVFSYLIKDNVFFGIALYLLVGVSSGFATLLIVRSVVIPMLISPLSHPGTLAFYVALVVLLLAILLIFMLFKRGSGMGRIPLAILVGVMAAIALIGISRGTLAPQLLATYYRISPGIVASYQAVRIWGLVEGLAILLGVVTVLIVFEKRQKTQAQAGKKTPVLDGISKVGQVFIGITFGALFVGLFSSALIALISNLGSHVDFFSKLFGG